MPDASVSQQPAIGPGSVGAKNLDDLGRIWGTQRIDVDLRHDDKVRPISESGHDGINARDIGSRLRHVQHDGSLPNSPGLDHRTSLEG